MLKDSQKVFLTGFMGVGKSTIARHLAKILKCPRLDLDARIEKQHGQPVSELILGLGVDRYRDVESDALALLLDEPTPAIVALGGGAFTIERNRKMIKEKGHTSVWLESTFEHCWMNIQRSKKVRPLAKDRETTRRLFDERMASYCLAEWHFLIKPEYSSYDIAKQIAEEVFCLE